MRYFVRCLSLIRNPSILNNPRHGSENSCPLPGLRIDKKPPAYRMDPLLHTQQSPILLRFFHVELSPGIVHQKLNLVLYTSQFNCELAHPAVLHGVM
jgi:hypothetical protein